MAQQQNQDSGRGLVNPADPIEMQRIQETKPAKTSTGPGETSVPNSKSQNQNSAPDKDATESDPQPLGTEDDGDQQVDRV